MDCRTFENEITRREAGLLDAAQLQALDAHLAGCAACAAADRKVKAGMSALAAIPVTPAPKDFLEDSWRRIQRAAPPEPTLAERVRRWFEGLGQPMWVPLGAAAAVLALVVLMPGMKRVQVATGPKYRILEQGGEVQVATAPNGAATLATRGNGRLVIEHLGRARYTVGANSRLEIGFGRPAAIELAAGAADVDVTPRPGEGYAVELSGARVEVLGTKFALTAGVSPMVRVTEGKVRVSGPDWRRELGLGDSVAWGDEGPVDPSAKPSPAPAATVAAASSPVAAAPKPVTSPSPVAAPVAAKAPVKPAAPASPAAVAATAAPSPAVEAPTGATAAPVETGAGSTVNDPFEK